MHKLLEITILCLFYLLKIFLWFGVFGVVIGGKGSESRRIIVFDHGGSDKFARDPSSFPPSLQDAEACQK